MSDGNADDDGGRITVKRERTVYQKETVTIKSKRGTGTNDRDEVRKEVVREAELDVPDGEMSRFPDLIGDEEMASTVADVARAMKNTRLDVSAEPGE